MSLSAAQLKMRRAGVTATDVVVLASGSDHYGRTIHDVWREKVLGYTAIAETEAMSLGNELEPLVIRRCAEKRGLRLVGPGKTIRHATVPHYLATPDAFARVDHTRGAAPALIQAKVVGYHASRAWGEDATGVDSLPEPVFVQVAWECFVSQRRIEYVGALLGTEVRTYLIDAEVAGVDELVLGLRELVDRFWTDHVLAKRPPEVDGSEGAKRMLRAMWPRPTRPALVAPPAAETWASRYFRAKEIATKAEAAKDLAAQKLEEILGPHEGMTGDGWRLRMPWVDASQVPAYTRKAHRRFDCRPLKGG
jgi:predicted phage-related endonuclease